MIRNIISRYDLLLLDLWGVVHDGSALYDGVQETLAALQKAGKKIIFLSNAPRRAARAEAVLSQLGVARGMYEHVVTSGEVGYKWLAEYPVIASAARQSSGAAGGEAGLLRFARNDGKKYYFIGAEKDEGLLADLDFVEVRALEDADFILNLGYGTEEQTTYDFTPLLTQAHALSLPMLCLNPDLEVVKISGEHFPCAGLLARHYERLGGRVTWFGKPYPEVYTHCHALVGTPKARILAVGDSVETDIPGGQRFGVDTLLITGGIMNGMTEVEIQAECARAGVLPTHILPSFRW